MIIMTKLTKLWLPRPDIPIIPESFAIGESFSTATFSRIGRSKPSPSSTVRSIESISKYFSGFSYQFSLTMLLQISRSVFIFCFIFVSYAPLKQHDFKIVPIFHGFCHGPPNFPVSVLGRFSDVPGLGACATAFSSSSRSATPSSSISTSSIHCLLVKARHFRNQAAWSRGFLRTRIGQEMKKRSTVELFGRLGVKFGPQDLMYILCNESVYTDIYCIYICIFACVCICFSYLSI